MHLIQRLWQRLGKLILVMGVTAALAGCSGGFFPTYFNDDPVSNSAEIVAAADWETAKTVVIDMRQNSFTPAVVRLTQGQPYILVLENRDDVTHVFAAKEFFRTTAVRQIVTDDKETPVHRLSTVSVLPSEIKEVYLVPLRDGWFSFEGADPGLNIAGISLSPFSRGAIHGMVGNFVVEP